MKVSGKINTQKINAVTPRASAFLICAVLGLSACNSDDSNDPPVDDPLTPDEEVVAPDTTTPPVTASPPTPSWTTAYDEGNLSPGRQALIGNDNMALVRSRELDGIEWLTALDPLTGSELWRLPDIKAQCAPVILADGNIVIQLEQSSAAAGNDNSHDLALVDAASGTILDQWQPGAGVFFNCSNGAGTGGPSGGLGHLMLSASNLVIHSHKQTYRGFKINEDDTIEPEWETELEFFTGYDETQVLGDMLYVMQRLERSAGDGIKVVYVRRIDASTGEIVATLETTLRSASRLQIAGPEHLAINGIDENADDALLLLSGAGPDSGVNDLAVAWQRVFDGNDDGVTAASANLALSDDAFASWAKIAAGSTVTEFDLATGSANWSFQTSSFNNNATIVALPAGGYLVAPFGGNFVEATTDTGDLAWRVETVEEADFPQGFATLGTDNLVVVSESPAGTEGWVAVGLSTDR